MSDADGLRQYVALMDFSHFVAPIHFSFLLCCVAMSPIASYVSTYAPSLVLWSLVNCSLLSDGAAAQLVAAISSPQCKLEHLHIRSLLFSRRGFRSLLAAIEAAGSTLRSGSRSQESLISSSLSFSTEIA